MYVSTGATDELQFGTVTNDNLGFFTNNATPAMTLDTSGRVGIGTQIPASVLSVSGGVAIGAAFNVAAPTNGLIVQGNTGIGTTTPNQTLHRRCFSRQRD
jgi:hypothetical protein